ncbi:Homeobox-leucine zipper protein ROC5 [Dichanthelium oligosanthes]|uniref:Homeobox-leucine zipper protein ROC5 n=1 Tax=Dichanthelium oligosanthes TaxID=888268 RepID=A0A1E5VSV4_9POAL|nr:Homeobox-leucine zipper protein ROC5 [Dichanthelium oligosanthes]
MSFGDLLGGAGDAPGLHYPTYGGVFASSPALSLAVADAGHRPDGSGERAGSVARGGGGSAKDEPEDESRSAMSGGHLDVVLAGGSEDDEDGEAGNPRKRKKRYHRHTPHQIQQLEAVFKECPHPDDKRRAELSKRLGLEPRQVKFWFQNRRTQMKMQAELQVLSPLVPRREVTFLRFCNQLAEDVWAVVDVSVDGLERDQCLVTNMNCRRLPSGCVVQDTPNGCKVTWVEHTEYYEASVHQLYRPLLRSGLAFGAGRWLATLQRQCECLAILMSSVAVPEHDSAVVPLEGKRSLLKLAERMMENFCAGVSASSAEWSKLDGLTGSMQKDVRVMVRKSVDEPGVPPGVVLSAATAVWMPVAPERLFNFLRNEGLRAEWDILSNGGPMQQMPTNTHLNSILILQETCTDKSGAMVVYAPVDFPAMQLVMGGGDSTYVALLPSGFAILPCGPSTCGVGHKTSGSLLTVAFQILVNTQPTAKLTTESVDTVYNLISCTIEKIKVALHCEV